VTLRLPMPSKSEGDGLASDLIHAQSLSAWRILRGLSPAPVTRPRRSAHATDGLKVLPGSPADYRIPSDSAGVGRHRARYRVPRCSVLARRTIPSLSGLGRFSTLVPGMRDFRLWLGPETPAHSRSVLTKGGAR
jgi:hypothetical protein